MYPRSIYQYILPLVRIMLLNPIENLSPGSRLFLYITSYAPLDDVLLCIQFDWIKKQTRK